MRKRLYVVNGSCFDLRCYSYRPSKPQTPVEPPSWQQLACRQAHACLRPLEWRFKVKLNGTPTQQPLHFYLCWHLRLSAKLTEEANLSFFCGLETAAILRSQLISAVRFLFFFYYVCNPVSVCVSSSFFILWQCQRRCSPFRLIGDASENDI